MMPIVAQVFNDIDTTDFSVRQEAKSPTRIVSFVDTLELAESKTRLILGHNPNRYANIPVESGYTSKITYASTRRTSHMRALQPILKKDYTMDDEDGYKSRVLKGDRKRTVDGIKKPRDRQPAKKLRISASRPKETYYVDFNGDPNNSNRETAMQAVNSKLHPTGNDHDSANGNMRNLFWGSMFANQRHKEILIKKL
jgi:hypothetical protein